tara:strand:+ start:427 stop:627 length:201 start_codon:yes stop_codon:yes gene_type:complete
MWHKQTNLAKAIWLLEQKSTLQNSVRRAIQRKKLFKARFTQIKLAIISRQWQQTAIKLNAMNEPTF